MIKRIVKFSLFFAALTITALIFACAPARYKAKFYANGELFASVEAVGGEAAAPAAIPEKRDYVFDGWFFDEGVWLEPFEPGEKISGNVRVFAKFDRDYTALEPFDYTVAGGDVTISGVKDAFATSLVVPSFVTRIESGTFAECGALKSLTLPYTGTEKEKPCAMEELFSPSRIPETLERVVIEGGTEISARAFENCAGLKYITLPETLTSIGKAAFSGCKALTAVVIPASVTEIGTDAFSSCDDLVSAVFTGELDEMPSFAFCGCESLSAVVLPTGLTKIGESAFSGAASLRTIILPPSVEEIGASAFSDSGIERITLPESVTAIGDGAFAFCAELSSVTINFNDLSDFSATENVFYFSKKLRTVTFGENVTVIPSNLFSNSSVVSVALPDKIEEVRARAFFGCASLTTFKAGENLSKIGESAFEDCLKLRSVALSDNTEEIEKRAFYDCFALKSINLDGVSTIGESAFAYSGLIEAIIPDSVTSLGATAFCGCASLTQFAFGGGLTAVPAGLLQDCSALTGVILTDAVEEIGGFAFGRCSSLGSVTIPSSVVRIGAQAFCGCADLAAAYMEPGAWMAGGMLVTVTDDAEQTAAFLTNSTLGQFAWEKQIDASEE